MDWKLSKAKLTWLIFILGVVSATGPLSIDLYLPALPQMTKTLNASASLVQLSLSACLVGLAVGQLIAGPLSDKYGRKNPLILGFILFSVISLMIAFTNSVTFLIILRFIQGLAGSAGQVLSRAIARDLFAGPRLTRFYSMQSAVNGIFPVISPVIGGFMIRFVNWQGIFILLAIIGFLILIGIIFGIQESLPSTQRIAGSTTKTIFQMFSLSETSASG